MKKTPFILFAALIATGTIAQVDADNYDHRGKPLLTTSYSKRHQIEYYIVNDKTAKQILDYILPTKGYTVVYKIKQLPDGKYLGKLPVYTPVDTILKVMQIPRNFCYTIDGNTVTILDYDSSCKTD